MKILVADDQPVIVEDILDEMSKLRPEAQCIGISDPSKIFETFKKHLFDIVLLDIDLAGFNGIDLAKKMLAVKPRTNIIYITGFEKFALESYKTVASGFLVKPVSTEMLEEALDNLRFPVSYITEEMLAEQYSGKNLIGARITMYREKCGLSPQELADELNVSIQTVYRWERGERIPDLLTFLNIAKALCIKPEMLINL